MNTHIAKELKSLAWTHLKNRELIRAKKLLRMACEAHPDDAEAWHLLGRIESALKHPEQAIKCHENAARLNPLSAAVNFHLGIAQASLEQYTMALASLKKCLALDASFPDVKLRISALYEKTGRHDQAIQYAEQVIKDNPGNTKALGRIARIHRLKGNIDMAMAFYNLILKGNPDDIHTAATLADMQIQTGAIEMAAATIEPFLKRDPVPKLIAYIFSDICRFTNRCSEAIELLENILQRPDRPRNRRRGIIFALAKLYDRTGEYDKAFAYISEANSLKQVAGNVRAYANQTDHLIGTWTAGFHSGLPPACLPMCNIQPVFIIGMPRSGTSLTEQILASHPLVYGAGELPTICDIRKSLSRRIGTGAGYPQCLGKADGTLMNACANEYLENIRSVSGDGYPVVTDKMPENFWDLGLISRLFPAARIIHCTRNPLDTCISCYFTDFSEGHEYTFNLATLGVYYRQYQRIMLHWKNTIKIPMLELRYEDLVSRPEETSRKLIEYCGLDWNEACLSPHKNQRAVLTASASQVRLRVYTTSVGRWRNYAAHIGELRHILGT